MEKYKDYNLLNRAAGCLAGQFCGDAFGAQYEFGGPMKDVSRAMGPSKVWGTAAGQITDDGEMALELTKSIMMCGGYYQNMACENYVRWYESRPFDIGGTTRGALSRSHIRNYESQANGALMRLSPLAVMRAGMERYKNEDADIEAVKDAAITHINFVCGWCNVILSRGISFAINTGDPQLTYKYMLSAAKEIGPCREDNEKILRSKEIGASLKGAGGWVVFALHNAMLQLITAKTPEEAIINTVKYGRDTDTNAAIAGALYGACYGISAFPKDWVETVEKCDSRKGNHPREYQYDGIDTSYLAQQLLKVGQNV